VYAVLGEMAQENRVGLGRVQPSRDVSVLRPALEVVGSTTDRAAGRPEKSEDYADHQQDDPENPKNVDREHESQDEQDNAEKDHGSPLLNVGERLVA